MPIFGKIQQNSLEHSKENFQISKETTKQGIYFSTEQNNYIKAFSNANYTGDTETRKSTTGFILKLGDSAIAWGSIQ